VTDALRVAVLLFVLVDPISAAVGAHALSTARPETERRMIVGTGAIASFGVLAIAAAVADPLLDALHISDAAAELAAGLVVVVVALDLLWQGPAGRVRPAPTAPARRLAVFPYAVPLLAGPASVGAALAWAAVEGAGTVIGAAALTSVAVAVVALAWRRPPAGVARVLGSFVALAAAVIAFDLVHDGVFAV
jgi:multiple antibiotic resistance protein